MASLRLVLSIALAGALLCPGTAGAQVADGAARSREAWVALREAKFAVPEGETAYGLLREMNALVASPDPFLRDNVAYEAAARWIYTDGLLSPEEQRGMLALWTGNLRQGLGERDGDAAFLRSFSALNLSIIAARDNREPFLSKPEFDAFLDAMLAYFAGERDTRGYDPATGWVHAAAHTADTLKFLARNSKLDAAQQARLLAAIDAKARDFGTVFQWAEDARIADVIVSLAARADFGQAAFDAWLATIPQRRKALWANAPAVDPSAFADVQNLTLMLRAALASLSMPAELTAHAAAARASIIATLRALR